MTSCAAFTRRAASLVAFTAIGIAACHGVTAPGAVGLVSFSLTLTPTTAGGTYIAVTIRNDGKGTVLLGRRCTIVLNLRLQRYENGDWQWQGPAIACPNYPDIGPIVLAMGESLQSEAVAYGPGRFRVVVFAAPGDESVAATMVPSGAVDIP